MTPSDIAINRLCQQQIVGTRSRTPAEVVSWLGAVQAQEYAGAKWSIGLRLPDSTDAAIEQAIAAKTIVRTWALRGTLHFIAAADIRWLLPLVSPGVISRYSSSYRQLGLDEATFVQSGAVMDNALQGGKQLTRKELVAELDREGIPTADLRANHLLYRAALDGRICFGPLRGRQQTFTRLDEWLHGASPPVLGRHEALAELGRRYFTSHGPATLSDFTWWSGLSAADARQGLDRVKPQLKSEIANGQTYWMPVDAPAKKQSLHVATLMPGYDEFLVAYKDRSASIGPLHTGSVKAGNGFKPTVVVNGEVVGTWRRIFKSGQVIVQLDLLSSPSEAEKLAIKNAIERYGKFVNMPVLSDGW